MNRLGGAAFLILLVLFGLRLGATVVPSSWLWGLDSVAYAGGGAKLTALLLFAGAVFCAHPSVSSRLGFKTGSKGGAERFLPWGAALIGLVLVVALPCRHLLLGDTQTYISAIDRGVRVSGSAHREPLPEAMMLWVHQIAGGNALHAFRVAGLVLGAAALGLSVLVARRLDRGATLALVSVIALGGGLQLFAQYPEYYAFAVVSGLLFIWLALGWIERRVSLPFVTAAYVVAGLCHAVYIFAAPALLWLWWTAWRRGERRGVVISIGLFPAVLFSVLALIGYPFSEIAKEAGRASAFLPPLGERTPRTSYGLFAPAHLADLFNALLLTAPAVLVLLPQAIWSQANRRAPWTMAQRFLALLAAGPVLFALIAQSELGMVRDWDLMVVPALLASLAVAARAGDLRRLGVALCLTGLVHAGAWLASNHDPLQARQRFSRIAENGALFGPKSRAELWRYLSAQEGQAGNAEAAVRACVRAIESEPDDRQNYRLLVTLRIEQIARPTGNLEAAIEAAVNDLRGRSHREGYLHYGIALGTSLVGREDIALAAAQRGFELEPKSSELAATLGDMLRRSGRDAEATAAYEASLAIDPNQPRARVGLAAMAGVRGDLAEARRLLQDALDRTPWSPQAQQFQRLFEQGGLPPDAFRRYIYIR